MKGKINKKVSCGVCRFFDHKKHDCPHRDTRPEFYGCELFKPKRVS